MSRLHLILALAASAVADYAPTYEPTYSPTKQCKGRTKCLQGTNEGCGSDEFCNFDFGNRGTCEACAAGDTCSRGLPNKGKKDCISCCGLPSDDPDEDEDEDECEDEPGWTDSYGDGCDWYEDNDTCAGYGSQPLKATDACCFCGGGSGGAYYRPTSRPTTPECIDEGRCGPFYGGTSCSADGPYPCCSNYDWCGSGEAWCGEDGNGIQPAFSFCGGGSPRPTYRPTPMPTPRPIEIPEIKFKENKGYCASGLDAYMGQIPCSEMKKGVLKKCWELCAHEYGIDTIVAVDGAFESADEGCSCYCQDDCQCIQKVFDEFSLAVVKGYDLPSKCINSDDSNALAPPPPAPAP